MKRDEFTGDQFRSRKVDLKPLVYMRAVEICNRDYGFISRENFSALVEKLINVYYESIKMTEVLHKSYEEVQKHCDEILFRKEVENAKTQKSRP